MPRANFHRTHLATSGTGLYLSTYSGYFNGDSTWFTSRTPTSSTGRYNLTSFSTGVYPLSRQIIGYFRPKVTDSYTFYSNVDDACYFWIGNKAISTYTNSNYDIREFEGETPKTSAPISLTGGQSYPLRIQWGNRVAGGEYTFYWSNSSTAKTSDFTGLLYYNPAGPGL